MRKALLTIAFVGLSVRGAAGELTLPESPAMMRAMADELARSMAKLELEDLPRPYLIEFKPVCRGFCYYQMCEMDWVKRTA